MPDPIPVVGSRGCDPGGPPPALTTSIYETHLGLVALTWSRAVLGLSLRADARLSCSDDGGGGSGGEQALMFRVRPWLFWKRRGSKRFHFKDGLRHCDVDLAWDLTRARFRAGGSPEPSAGFFVAFVVDGEMVLTAGDLREEAHKRTKAHTPISPFVRRNPALVSRREHVVVPDSGGVGRTYKTTAVFGGKEREISINLGVEKKEKVRVEPTMRIAVDGQLVLHVRRLRWMFRGSETMEAEGSGRIQVAWDLHRWIFERWEEPAPAPASAELAGHAMFVFRFEREVEGKEPEVHSWKKDGGLGLYEGIVGGGYFGKIGRRAWSNSGGGGGGGEESRRGRRKSGLLKTSSSSSVSISSTSSTASSWTVMEWGSPEEAEMQKGDAFALIVHMWKS